ncbi:MAG: hypothetical protein IH973_06840, partial [Myxococcales bacterium]|nr:hypothetical protein [Myxococcales bacterium]
FLGRLLVIINRYHLEPIGGAAKVKDFFSYTMNERRVLTGAVMITGTHWHDDNFDITSKMLEHLGSPNRPYFIVFPGFVIEAMEASLTDTIHLVFDSQGDAEAHAKDHFDRLKKVARGAERLSSITFAASIDELPLQAADMYAYTWHAKLSGRQMSTDLSRAFAALTHKKPVIAVQGKQYLDELLKRIADDQRAAIARGRAEAGS